jgi:hypothetical protein
MVLQEPSLRYTNMTDALHEDLLKRIPYLDTTLPKTYDLTRYDSTDMWYDRVNVDLNQGILMAWLSFLSFGVLALFIKALIDCKTRRRGRVSTRRHMCTLIQKQWQIVMQGLVRLFRQSGV